MTILSAEQVAKQLGVSAKTVKRLGIPTMRISGKIIRYTQEQLDAWLQGKIEYAPEVKKNGRNVPKRPQNVGLQKVISRKALHAISVDDQGGGRGRLQ